MAFMLLGTFSHLLDTDSALRCLKSTHAALQPGGLLVLELSHPTEVFDGTLLQPDAWGEDEDDKAAWRNAEDDNDGKSEEMGNGDAGNALAVNADADRPSGDFEPGELAVQYGGNADDFDALDQVQIGKARGLSDCADITTQEVTAGIDRCTLNAGCNADTGYI